MPKKLDHVFGRVCSIASLDSAHRRARRGQRGSPAVKRFECDLATRLWELHRELDEDRYRPGPWSEFWIREGKLRLISAPLYRDRVVHQSIAGVLEPFLDPRLISDCYACRWGKGQHRALSRAQQFGRRSRWVLKLDVAKYFPSIDHQRLVAILSRHVADSRLLALIEQILAAGEGVGFQLPERPHFPQDNLIEPYIRAIGLPLGSLVSQLLANLYLDPLDRAIKQEWRVARYLRYMDDMLLFGGSKRELRDLQQRVQCFLARELRLVIHPHKTQIARCTEGVPFLGWRVFPIACSCCGARWCG